MRIPRLILLVLTSAALLGEGGCDPVISEDPYEPPAMAAGAPRAAPDEHSLYGRLQSSDRNVRIEAIFEAARHKDPQAAAYLIDRLGDGCVEVRFAAIVALEKIAGTSRGYRYWAPPGEREEAVARWRTWLRDGSNVRGAEAAP